MKVALIQYDIAWLDAEKNRHYLNEVFKNLDSDIQLILLPEMFDTGFCTAPHVGMTQTSAETIQWLQLKAVENNACIGGSIIVPEEGRFYNRFFWAQPDGQLKTYDKRHLFSIGNEHLNYAPGKQKSIMSFSGFRFLPQICYDLRFPVFSRCRNDYDVLIYVANWPAPRADVWCKLLMARAIENQCYVLAVNRTGIDGNGIVHQGNSMIIDFKGNVMAEAQSENNEVVMSEIFIENLSDFRTKFPSWKDSDSFSLDL
jgi:predicted amidohydrolase